jgi:3-methyladenine DNA glycosylase AlkD
MTPSNYIEQVKSNLTKISDDDKAQQMSAYLKNKFEFLGIPAPLRRSSLKLLNQTIFSERELFQIAENLWLLPQREYRYVAIDLLDRNNKQIKVTSIPLLLKLAKSESWWETVDSLSGVIGDVLLRERKVNFTAQEIMDKAIVDSNFWVRRVALVHQLGWRLQTDEERLFRYAVAVSSEKEFFIRKAIGWALRDYARWNPEAVRSFVRNNQFRFSRLTITEATKHIDI